MVGTLGTPLDTLRFGRSKATALVRRTRPDGRALVVESDVTGADELLSPAQRQRLSPVKVAALHLPGRTKDSYEDLMVSLTHELVSDDHGFTFRHRG